MQGEAGSAPRIRARWPPREPPPHSDSRLQGERLQNAAPWGTLLTPPSTPAGLTEWSKSLKVGILEVFAPSSPCQTTRRIFFRRWRNLRAPSSTWTIPELHPSTCRANSCPPPPHAEAPLLPAPSTARTRTGSLDAQDKDNNGVLQMPRWCLLWLAGNGERRTGYY